jgi:hypothetical protein
VVSLFRAPAMEFECFAMRFDLPVYAIAFSADGVCFAHFPASLTTSSLAPIPASEATVVSSTASPVTDLISPSLPLLRGDARTRLLPCPTTPASAKLIERCSDSVEDHRS